MSAIRTSLYTTRAAACVGLLATAAAVHAMEPPVFYVDDDAPAGGDGLGWATAFRSLTDALNLVRDRFESGLGGFAEIRVAQGVYAPGNGSQDRDATFTLLSGTTILGGYAGIGASDPDEHDPSRFVSVLSGDLLGDDLPGLINRADNAYHVVTFDAGGNYAGVYGCVIRGGHADGDGARGIGGGVTTAHEVGLATVGSCTVADNFAIRGGGIGSDRGLFVVHSSLLTGNVAQISGGGAWFGSDGYLELSRFVANSVISASGSGGAISLQNSGGTIGNSTFASNSAQSGSAIAVDTRSFATVVNTILAFNGASPGAQVTSPASGVVNMGHCLVKGFVDSRLLASGSVFNFAYVSTDPRFVSLHGLDGIAGTLDDDLRPSSATVAIDAGLAESPWYQESSLPWAVDLAGAPRFHDDPAMPNIGAGWRTDVDIGAYEFQGTSCRADHDGDGAVGVPDIFAFLADWFAHRADADFNRDGVVGVPDIFAYLSAWFARC